MRRIRLRPDSVCFNKKPRHWRGFLFSATPRTAPGAVLRRYLAEDCWWKRISGHYPFTTSTKPWPRCNSGAGAGQLRDAVQKLFPIANVFPDRSCHHLFFWIAKTSAFSLESTKCAQHFVRPDAAYRSISDLS